MRWVALLAVLLLVGCKARPRAVVPGPRVPTPVIVPQGPDLHTETVVMGPALGRSCFWIRQYRIHWDSGVKPPDVECKPMRWEDDPPYMAAMNATGWWAGNQWGCCVASAVIIEYSDDSLRPPVVRIYRVRPVPVTQ